MPAIDAIHRGVTELTSVIVRRNPPAQHEILEAFLVSRFSPFVLTLYESY